MRSREEIMKGFWESGMTKAEGATIASLEVLLDIRDLLQKDDCPPHDLVDHIYSSAWSSTVPMPNKKCTKCLNLFYV